MGLSAEQGTHSMRQGARFVVAGPYCEGARDEGPTGLGPGGGGSPAPEASNASHGSTPATSSVSSLGSSIDSRGQSGACIQSFPAAVRPVAVCRARARMPRRLSVQATMGSSRGLRLRKRARGPRRCPWGVWKGQTLELPPPSCMFC